MKKYLFIILIICKLSYSMLGGKAAPYSRMGVGVRSLSMGNTGTALFNKTTVTPYWNPAMMVILPDKYYFSAGLRMLSLGRREGYFFVTLKAPPRASLGLSAIYHGDHSIDIYNSNGDKYYEGNFQNVMVCIALSYKINKRMAIGINTTMHKFSLVCGNDKDYDQLSTVELGNIDLSFFYKMKKNISFGVNVKDVNSNIDQNAPTYATDLKTIINEYVPLNIKSAVEYNSEFKKHKYTANYEIDTYIVPSYSERDNYFKSLRHGETVCEHHLGIEFFMYPQLAIRTGAGTNEGFSLGVGFYFYDGNLANGNFDYVFSVEPNGSGFNNGLAWSYSW